MADNVTTQSSTLATIPASTVIATHVEGTNSAHVQVMSEGGNLTVAVAAGTAGNTVVKNVAALLARVLVTTAGTNSMSIYDNATTTSGTVIGIIPANTPAGSIFPFQMPAANGITVGGNSNNPGVTIAYA